MSDQPTTDRHRRPTPEPGSRWVDYVPAWVRYGVPLATLLVALVGFVLGWGEGQGRAEARLNGLDGRADRIETQRDGDRAVLVQVQWQLAELRGEVRSIARALRIPLEDDTPLAAPVGPVVREVGPEVTP